MDDYDFEKLSPAGRWYFIGLLLLAGKMQNNIPFDSNYLSKKLGGNPDDISETIKLIDNTLIVIIKDKIRIDKIRGDSPKSARPILDKVKTTVKPIYRKFAHLSITVEDNQKLLNAGNTQLEINDTYDSIENYKKNTNYKSLYLTAKKWLNKENKTKEQDDDRPKNIDY